MTETKKSNRGKVSLLEHLFGLSPNSLSSPGSAETGMQFPAKTHIKLGMMLVFVVVFVAYIPASFNGYIWDDDHYVTSNQNLRSVQGLYDIWFKPRATPQYYPLVHTSYWLEYQFWELHPTGYHVVNNLLHAVNSVLLYLLLSRLNVPYAFWCAVLFGVHPVHVESVAWITERKNVLSATFYLAAFHLFMAATPLSFVAGSIQNGASGDSKATYRWGFYLVAVIFFIAALLSKTITCSLPAAILLVIWWKRGVIRPREILATAPLFFIGVFFAYLTVRLEKDQVGAIGAEFQWSFLERCVLAGNCIWFYAWKLVCPYPLAFFYHRWEIDLQSLAQVSLAIAVIAVVIGLFVTRQRIGRGPLVAVLYFCGTLFPALGFFNVYPMRYSYVADHFQYLASIGILVLVPIAIAIGLNRIVQVNETSTAGKFGFHIGASIVAFILVLLTFNQCRIYSDEVTLWKDTLEKTPTCAAAYNNLARTMDPETESEEMEMMFRKAVELAPTYFRYQFNLASMLARDPENLTDAAEHFAKSAAAYPEFWLSSLEQGVCLSRLGDHHAAVRCFRTAVKYESKKVINPGFIPPDAPLRLQVNLGTSLIEIGELEEAKGLFGDLQQPDETKTIAKFFLGWVALEENDFRKAAQLLVEFLTANPNDAEARIHLGDALVGLGRKKDALTQFRKAMQLDPARNDLAERIEAISEE